MENFKLIMNMGRWISALSCLTNTTLDDAAVMLHNYLVQKQTELGKNCKDTQKSYVSHDVLGYDRYRIWRRTNTDDHPCFIAHEYNFLYTDDYDKLVNRFEEYLHGQIPRIDLTAFPLEKAPSRQKNNIKGSANSSVNILTKKAKIA